MTDFRQSVENAIARVSVHSRTACSWFDVPLSGLPPETEAAIDAAAARGYLAYQLQSLLYGNFYCPGEARPFSDGPQDISSSGPSPFIQELSAANSGSGSREPGWTYVARDGERLVVERGGIRIWAVPGEVHGVPGASLEPGASVSVQMPKELLRLSPGFYMALGNAEFQVEGTDPIIRFYWNLRNEGAAQLVGVLTKTLNGQETPFRLKVVSEPGNYRRSDAGVLYAPSAHYEAVAEEVRKIYRDVGWALKPATPAFTKRLAPGLGLAEDPAGSSSSFGMNRCALLAEGIVRAAERGAEGLHERMSVVLECFAESGIDIDAPYLGPKSTDRYRFAFPA